MRLARIDGAGTPFDWPEAIGYGRAPYASLSAGAWQFTAGPAGVALGTFGWVDPDSGLVSNTLIPGALLGVILPVPLALKWSRTVVRGPYRFLRHGLGCIVAAVGNFAVRLPLGGQIGAQIYADSTTGLPYAAGTFNQPSMDDSEITMDSAAVRMDQTPYVPTGWTLMQSGAAGARLRISSFVKPLFN